MWLPEQLPELADELREAGLALDAVGLGDLSRAPLAAIVSLGGCSASFVSPRGLVLTNHHCAEGALTLNSTTEDNLWRDGFLAGSLEEERWAGPGARVLVTVGIDDVTRPMHAARDAAADDRARWEAMDRTEKELVAQCEQTAGLRCAVVPVFDGLGYRLVRQLEIPDVRIVHAPPAAIGFYGGDDDNWRWPRHTGDYTFFRAWVGPDGLPAPHDEANVPFSPEHWLTLGLEGVAEGDFVMVAGYPGRTSRYRTAEEMRFARDTRFPWQLERLQEVLAILDARMEEDEDARVRLNSLRFGLANFEKYSRGILDGLDGSGAVERSAAREEHLRQALRSAGEHAALGHLEALDLAVVEAQGDAMRETLFGWMRWNVRLLGAASTVWRVAREREKDDDLDRDAGFQERDWPRLREQLARVERTFDPVADERLLAYWLEQAAQLPATARIVGVDALLAEWAHAERPAEAAAAAVMGATGFRDPEIRMAMFEASRAELEASDDPLLTLVRALAPLETELIERSRVRAGEASRLRPAFMGALQEHAGQTLYPDANSTLRITFGHVRGYDGPDAVSYRPLTTLRGLLEKERGEEPFASPAPLLEAIRANAPTRWHVAELGSVPVNFLSTLDTTGGNSGSATLDRHGRLVGLLFDGNYEAMASDWLFDPVSTRSIHVDVRYMLWVMEQVSGAHALLEELGVR